MFIKTKKVTSKYVRYSKCGKEHTYTRTKTVVIMQCDSCQNTFEREQGLMSRKRAGSDYYHVCPTCNQKQFAQKRGVERRQMWKLSADSDIDISKI